MLVVGRGWATRVAAMSNSLPMIRRLLHLSGGDSGGCWSRRRQKQHQQQQQRNAENAIGSAASTSTSRCNDIRDRHSSSQVGHLPLAQASAPAATVVGTHVGDVLEFKKSRFRGVSHSAGSQRTCQQVVSTHREMAERKVGHICWG
jgi:hypothetical protein